MLSRIPSSTEATALTGIATCLRPHRWPSLSRTWVTAWSPRFTMKPSTCPISPSTACTRSCRSTSVSPSGMAWLTTMGRPAPRIRPEPGLLIPKSTGMPRPGTTTGSPLGSLSPVTSTSSAGSNSPNSASVQRSLISPGAASASSTGTSRPAPFLCLGSTTRWVTVPAAGSRIVRLTTPQNPSVQLAFAPSANSAGITAPFPRNAPRPSRHRKHTAVITRRGRRPCGRSPPPGYPRHR